MDEKDWPSISNHGLHTCIAKFKFKQEKTGSKTNVQHFLDACKKHPLVEIDSSSANKACVQYYTKMMRWRDEIKVRQADDEDHVLHAHATSTNCCPTRFPFFLFRGCCEKNRYFRDGEKNKRHLVELLREMQSHGVDVELEVLYTPAMFRNKKKK